jgi:hypothetical protein
MKRLLIIAVAMFGLASAYLKSYEVTPTQASWSGWARGDPQYGVGNTFVANFDSITEVQFFVGYVGDTSHHYNIEVRDYASNTLVAYRYYIAAPTASGHVWLKFDMQTQTGQKFVRGREYVLRVTRPGENGENAGLDFECSESTMS